MYKGVIVIVECISSGVNYIHDIYELGYEPVLLEPYENVFSRGYMRRFHDMELAEMMNPQEPRPRILMAKRSYNDTLEMIRSLHPAAVLQGSDRGIELATRLSADLGLKGNDPANLPKMRNKYICQQALKEAGVRCIESEMASTLEEAMAFYKRMAAKGKGVVVKPASGISSMGVFVCKTEQEMKNAFLSNKNNPIFVMYNGRTGKVLVQECIEGDEYIVNSVSCGGEHKITFLARYTKIILPGKGKIYDYDRSLQPDQPQVPTLCDYQMKVLDAIGITYGAVHSEIMMDEDGPVLIEANCRICGGNVNSSIYEEAIGLSESRYSLQSVLDPALFKNHPERILGNTLGKTVLLIEIRNHKSQYIKKLHIKETLGKLPSYRYYFARKEKGFFSETVNLTTDIATVMFVCQGEQEIRQVVDYVHELEDNHPEKLYDGVYIPVLCEIAAKFMA